MIEIVGKYTQAKIFTDLIEPKALNQVNSLCNHPLFEDQTISIMPDVHPSKGTVVGLSATLGVTNLIPSLIGSDAGCGMLIVKLKNKTVLDFSKLDKVIHNLKSCNYVYPSLQQKLDKVCSIKSKWIKDTNTYLKFIGTLGGGNHFISIEKGETGTYLIIHSGSRVFGQDIAIHYCDLAIQQNPYENGEQKQLSWLNEEDSKQYLYAIDVAQYFASNNRYCIAQNILKEMKWKVDTDWEVSYTDARGMLDIPHNFIQRKNDDYVIIRKGCQAIDVQKLGIIPINMADGSLLIKGKDLDFSHMYYSNWNYSMAHGAGRTISRSDCKEKLTMQDYKKSMKNIYSSCVSVNTIDESPMAYKTINDIEKHITDIVDVVDHLIPLYNFKNSSQK